MKFVDFLKKAWKFIVGIIAGIGATLLIGRLFRGKTNRTHLPINGDSMSDRLLSDVYDNGRRISDVRERNQDTADAISRAKAELNRSLDGFEESRGSLATAEDILKRIRARRSTDSTDTSG